MAKTFGVEVVGLNVAMETVAGIGDAFSGREILPMFDEMADEAIKIAGPLIPEDTGALRASLDKDVSLSAAGDVEAEAFYDANVAIFIEEDTVPHWPPIDALIGWAERHGFPPGRAGAFLVARSIAQKGTKGKHVMQRTAREIQGKLGCIIDRHVDRILRNA